MFIEIIVMPREERPPARRSSERRGREVLARSWQEEGKAFHASVLEFIKAHHLLGAVKWMSEPGMLPQVTLVASERVLEKLKSEPRFEAGRSLSLNLQT